MTEAGVDPTLEADPPPATGHPAVDRALTDAVDAVRQPLADRADALGVVHERLHRALDTETDAVSDAVSGAVSDEVSDAVSDPGAR